MIRALCILILCFALPGGAVLAETPYGFLGNYGLNRIHVAEHDALRRQIRSCWNVPAQRKRENLEVHVRITTRTNGTVKKARIVGSALIQLDPYYRAVAQSARRALLGTPCNPLRLPQDGSVAGNSVTLTINLQDVFAN